MKRILLPILLLTINAPAVAMWSWFRKKPTVVTTTPATEATISATEPVTMTEKEVIEAQLQEAPVTVTETESEQEFILPKVEKIAGATLALPSERVFVAALNNGDVATVKQLIDEQRVDVTKPFKLLFYAGETPLEVTLASDKPERLEIAGLLLEAGANKQDLNRFLQDAVAADDYEQVMWLLDRGAKDTDDKALELIENKRANVQEEATEAPVAVEEELITIEKPIINYPFKAKQLLPNPELEQKEVAVTAPEYTVTLESETVQPITPVRPAITRLEKPLSFGKIKPAPAQPKPTAVEPSIPVAVKQPLRLRPMTLPAPAQPKPAVLKQPLRLRPLTLPAPAQPK